jgi:hypothetical protein
MYRCGELTHGLDGTNATMTRETWTGGTYSHAWVCGNVFFFAALCMPDI